MLSPGNEEAKAVDLLCRSSSTDVSRPGRPALVNPNEGERRLVSEQFVVVGGQFEVLHRAAARIWR